MLFERPKPRQSNGDSLFVRIKDGETVNGVLRGEPHKYYVVWENNKSQVVPEGTPGAKLRYKMNFIIKDSDGLKAKILEFGPMLADIFANLEMHYELQETAIAISRRGVEKDTTYTAVPLPPKQQPTPEGLERIKQVPLQIIDKKPKEDLDFLK